MTKRIIFSLFASALPAGAYFLNGGTIFAVLILFLIFFGLLFRIGFRKSSCIILAVIAIVVSLEFILFVLDKNNILNFKAKKTWLLSSLPHKSILVCYPTNPRRYFNIDLRNNATRIKYGIKEDECRDSPFCAEENYNSLDYREREIAGKKDKPRFIFLGDSFTSGEGVKLNDRFSDMLKTRYWSGNFEVYNFGATGAGINEVYSRLFKDALASFADIIVYCYNLNDPILIGEIAQRQKYINDLMNIRYYNTDLYKFFEEKIHSAASRFMSKFYRLESGLLLNSKIAFVSRYVFFNRRIARETVSWYKDMYTPHNKGWDITKELILKMRDESNANNIFFAVVILPIFYNFENYPFIGAHAQIEEFCRQNHIPVLDTFSAFKSSDYRKCIAHPLDYHPNENAHAMLAMSINEFIENNIKRGKLKLISRH